MRDILSYLAFVAFVIGFGFCAGLAISGVVKLYEYSVFDAVLLMITVFVYTSGSILNQLAHD